MNLDSIPPFYNPPDTPLNNPLLGTRKPIAPPPTEPTKTLYVRNLNEAMNHNSGFFPLTVSVKTLVKIV